MPSPLLFWAFMWLMFAVGVAVGYNWQKRRLKEEIEALRKLAHDYIQAYEKLAFGDAPTTGGEDD